MTAIPALVTGLCDDAALFPPGNAPLAAALPAHAAHLVADYAALMGPFVFPTPRLRELATVDRRAEPLSISLTVPGGPEELPDALDRVQLMPGIRLAALEIAATEGQSATEFFAALDRVRPTALDVYIEVPRGERRTAYLEALTGSEYGAKFRTGGTVAGAYPGEAELAHALHAVVGAAVPFKATAGMHHAVRNTEPATGFEQHGFLNVVLAVAQALDGADPTRLALTLADRDGARIAAELSALNPQQVRQARNSFHSFGTCSISDPLADLIDLGLMPSSAQTPTRKGMPA